MKKVAKNKYGQYFTPKAIAEFMVDLATVKADAKVLEPSCGEGVFLDVLQEKGFRNLSAYEIDQGLGRQFGFVKYESFVTAKIEEGFDLIIGNPPYIRWKNLEPELKQELASNELWNNHFNSLCDYLYIFILKSIELLNENGELIFICPEYWMNTKHSITLRNYMVENGCFEKIYHFNETPIFNKITVSLVVFKYIKSESRVGAIEVVMCHKQGGADHELRSLLQDRQHQSPYIQRFTIPQFEKNEHWLLASNEEVEKIKQFEYACVIEDKSPLPLHDKKKNILYPTIGEVCDIGNGMVSGLDKAFQFHGKLLNEAERSKTIEVVKAKQLIPFLYTGTTNYIFANDIVEESKLKAECPTFYEQLIEQKEKLEKRYQYNRKIDFWHWVFLRNYHLFSKDCPRIFVPCKERISNKDYFRFAYIPSGIYPTQDVTAIFPKPALQESIYYLLAFLNNHRVFNWLKNKGVVKGEIVEFSEKPLASIPFRKINWENLREVLVHGEIEKFTKEYIKSQNSIALGKVKELFDELFEMSDKP